jgi:S1-C subfamily serine protease
MLTQVGIGLLVALLLVVCPRAQAGCVDPSKLTPSTVSFVRIFQAGDLQSDIVGTAGTAWLLSHVSLVTAGHVVESMSLSAEKWTEIELRQHDRKITASVRLQRLLGVQSERIAVVELREPLPNAVRLPVRTTALAKGEPVVSVAYPGRRQRIASGRFMRYGDGGDVLLEMYDGNDRFAIDHGASGAPVVDCEGKAVAVVTGVLSQTVTILSQQIRISTPWETPNVIAVPIASLNELAKFK